MYPLGVPHWGTGPYSGVQIPNWFILVCPLLCIALFLIRVLLSRHTPVTWLISDKRSRIPLKGRSMTEGRRFIQIDPLDKSLLKEAERRWREARRALFGVADRDKPAREAPLAKPASNKRVAAPRQKALT